MARLFGTDGIRGVANVEPMTSETALKLGRAAAHVFKTRPGRHRIVIGKDTDGTTRPGDLGVISPLARKKVDFIGRRSLLTQDASRDDRRELVGLTVASGENPLPTGAHGVVRESGRVRSIGYVTSSYFSPTLGKPIALALIERGRRRVGESILVQHLGAQRLDAIFPGFDADRSKWLGLL